MVQREDFGLPARTFLYTLDQIAFMLSLSEQTLKTHYIHYYGRSVGPRPHDRMEAKDIAPNGEKPEWRVAEAEFIRYLKYKGFRIFERIIINR